MDVSRRNFMRGASACAVAAAVPLPVLSDDYWPLSGPVMWSRNVTPPIFEGSIGVYQGVIIREVPALPVMSAGMMRQLEYLAETCHPRAWWLNGDGILEAIDGR